MKYPSVYEFLCSSEGSAWCREGKIKLYLRKEGRGLISITNMYSVVPGRSSNVCSRERYIRTGHFAETMNTAEQAVLDCGFYGLYFGSVVNEFLPGVLERRGYFRQREYDFGHPRYVLYMSAMLRKSA